MKQTFTALKTIDDTLLQFQTQISSLTDQKIKLEEIFKTKESKIESEYQKRIECINKKKEQIEKAYNEQISQYTDQLNEATEQYKKAYTNIEKSFTEQRDSDSQRIQSDISRIDRAVSDIPSKLINKTGTTSATFPFKHELNSLNGLHDKIMDTSFSATLKRTLHLGGYSSKAKMTQEFIQKSEETKSFLKNQDQNIQSTCDAKIKAEQKKLSERFKQRKEAIEASKSRTETQRKNALDAQDTQIRQAREWAKNQREQLVRDKKAYEQGLLDKGDNLVAKINAFLDSDLVSKLPENLYKIALSTGAANDVWESYNPNSNNEKYWIGYILVPSRIQSAPFSELLKKKISKVYNGTHYVAPVNFPAQSSQQIFIHYKPNYTNTVCDFVQQFILQKMRCNKIDSLEIYFADPNRSGQIIGALAAPVQDNEAIGIFSINSKEAIRNKLKSIAKDIDEINGLLGNCSNIFEYNQSSKDPIKEKCLVLYDVGGWIEKEDFEQLKIIWNNAERCGITIIVVSEKSINEIPTLYAHQNIDVQFMNSDHLFTIECQSDTHQIKQGNGSFTIKLAGMNDARKAFVNVYREAVKNHLKVDNRFLTHFKPQGTVPYKSLSPDYRGREIRLPILMHNRPDGDIYEFVIDSVSHVHTLITGSAGSGKTTLLHMIISSIIMNYHPDDVELWLLDYGKVSFKKYLLKRPKHVRLLALEDTQTFTFSFLDFIVKEINKRATLFKQNNVENIDQYREQYGQLSLPRIVLIIDEFHLMVHHAKEDLKYRKILENILQVYRKYGICCIFSNQTADTGLRDVAKDQINNKIAMKQPLQGIKDTLSILSTHYTDEILRQMECMEGYGDAWCKFPKSENKNDFSLEYFKAIYPTDIDLEDILDASLARNDTVSCDTYVYVIDSEEPKCLIPGEITTEVSKANDRQISVCLGVPTTIERDFVFTLDPRHENNILIAGTPTDIDSDIDIRLIVSLIVSAALNRSSKVNIFADPDEDKIGLIRDYIQLYDINDRVCFFTEYDAICSEVWKQKNIIKAKETQTTPILNVWFGLRDIFNELSYYEGSAPASGSTSTSDSDFTETSFQLSDDKAQQALIDEDILALAQGAGLDVVAMMTSLGASSDENQTESQISDSNISKNIYNAGADIIYLINAAGRYSIFNAVIIEDSKDIKKIQQFNVNDFYHKLVYKLPSGDNINFEVRREAESIEPDIILYTDGRKNCTFRPYYLDNQVMLPD